MGGGRGGTAQSAAQDQTYMVGKYMDLLDAYKSLNEALIHAGIHTSTDVDNFLGFMEVEEKGVEVLNDADAILVPGGFGGRGFEGKRRRDMLV